MRRPAPLLSAVPALLAVVAILWPAASAAATLKAYDFEGQAAREWSERGAIQLDRGRALGPFNQRHNDVPHEVTLKPADMPAGKTLKLTFDLILFGCWDETGPLADRFEVSVNGKALLDLRKFPCGLTDEAENLPAGAPGSARIFNRTLGVCVLAQTVTLPAELVATGMEIRFKGFCTGRHSEFWALDNVRLETAG